MIAKKGLREETIMKSSARLDRDGAGARPGTALLPEPNDLAGGRRDQDA